MKWIPKHMMIKHAGLSIIMLYVPEFLPMGGTLGALGYGVTWIGFLINLPGLFLLKLSPVLYPDALFNILMIGLTEFSLFVIPKAIMRKMRKKKEAEPAIPEDVAKRPASEL